MDRMNGRCALVTGAAGDVGGSIVRAFVENGSSVLATGRTDEKVEAVIEALGLADSDEVITRGLDQSDLGSWWDLANLVDAFFNELDVFVYVAEEVVEKFCNQGEHHE